MAPAQRVLIVFGQGRSQGLAHRLLATVQASLAARGVECRLHDLLADGFDPVLRLGADQESAEAVDPERDPLVAGYQADVLWASRLVIIHPVWWFAPPAILKGWVDRVLAGGVALDHGTEPPRGLLAGRRALVLQTLKASSSVDRWVMAGISRKFWKRAVFPSVGIEDSSVLSLHGAQEPWGKRLEVFEQRLVKELTHLVPGTD